MIRSRQFRNGNGAKGASRYYAEALDPGDAWLGGRGREPLGLEGIKPDQEAFAALDRNRHPVTGEKITPRQNRERRAKDKDGNPVRVPNRRTGRDLCFVVPK